MGEVYRARDTRLDRTVAVKILPTHLSDNPEFRQRFEREARAISSLNHSHICQLYDVGSHDGTDFLVMEFLDGETLAERLKKGALPLPELLKVGLDVAGALEIAHRAGIVHRDLKPGNIMLTKGGAKLMDFGLAKPAALCAPGSASAPLLSASRTISGPRWKGNRLLHGRGQWILHSAPPPGWAKTRRDYISRRRHWRRSGLVSGWKVSFPE